jgi:hypothetical protein
MKKLLAVVLAIAMLASISGVAMAKSPQTEFDANGWHYNLNLIGKDKVMPGDYDNPDRHTMFIPEDTTGMTFTTKNGTVLDGVRIDVTKGDDFAVIDGNVTDDGIGAFEIGGGTYDVYIAVKAKNPHKTDPYTTLTGWIEYSDPTGTIWYLLKVGEVTARKADSWKSANDAFYVNCSEDPYGIVSCGPGDGMWIFDYLAALNALPDYENAAYFWQIVNTGNKLIQLRFYPR